MADISMCKNTECERHLQCYRFTAMPTPERQAYESFYVDGYGKCEYFIDNTGRQNANTICLESQ